MHVSLGPGEKLARTRIELAAEGPKRAFGRLGVRLRIALDASTDLPTEARAPSGPGIRLLRGELELDESVRGASRQHQPDAYRLSIDEAGVEITASGVVGWCRGLRMLARWLELHPIATERPGRQPGEPGLDLAIHGLEILDWPDFPTRGLMLDISRNRVPRMAELERWIDRMADLGLDQLQLYTEHTYAYRGHETVWRGWSPIRPEEIRHLVAYARERCVELVPNQNSFGHLHRWLVHEPYRRLAECPEGIDHPFAPEPEPFGLCPGDAGSLELLADLYGQLLPGFESPLFNVGLDETLDLGRCRSRAECEARGTERVYLDFLLRVHALARSHGRRIQFWGDIILKRPDLIDELPDDVIALAWGYEPDHPFAEECGRFAASGRELYVCPGTGSWSSFGGRWPEALHNLANAARHGHRHGASGMLIADWGDHGHLQPPPVAWPGVLAGACFAWNADRARDPDSLPIVDLLALHLVADELARTGPSHPLGAQGLARVMIELAEIHAATGARSLNGSALFYALHFAAEPPAERRGEGITIGHLDATLERLAALADELAPALADGSPPTPADDHRPAPILLVEELRWVADVLAFAARFARARLVHGIDAPAASLPPDERSALVAELDLLAIRLRPLWLARSREGGLEASIGRLLATRALLTGIDGPEPADRPSEGHGRALG